MVYRYGDYIGDTIQAGGLYRVHRGDTGWGIIWGPQGGYRLGGVYGVHMGDTGWEDYKEVHEGYSKGGL